MLDYLIKATLIIALGFPLGPVTWSCVMAAIVLRLSKPVPFRRQDLFPFFPFLITAAILAYGTVFAYEGGIAPDLSRQTPILILLGFQVVVSGVLVWLSRETRVATTFFMIFAFCFSLPAAFEASMSVANRWL